MSQPWQTPFLDRMEQVLATFFRHFHSRIEAEGGLSPSQYFLLRSLAEGGVHTVSDLADHLDMTAAGATGLIDRLVRAGLVLRRRDEEDRRVVRVDLSPEGAGRLAEARRLRRRILAEYFAPLTEGEAEQLIAMYQKLTDHLTRTTDKGDGPGA